jgi:hypothetical protein
MGQKGFWNEQERHFDNFHSRTLAPFSEITKAPQGAPAETFFLN